MGKHGSILPGRDYQAFLNERPALVGAPHNDLTEAVRELTLAIRDHTAVSRRIQEALEKGAR